MQSLLLLVSICVFTCSSALAVEFSADIVTQGFAESRGKIYFKNIAMHRSEGMGMINITKSPVVYQLVTDTKKYTVQNLEDQQLENPMGDFANIKEMVEKNNIKETGKETIEGVPCVIYEGKVKIDGEAPPVPMKIWYSEELEVPVKQEMNFGAPMGKIVSLLHNITVGKQNSSLFDIPPGYEKVNSMEEAMGMGNFQMPGMGGESGQGPSEEDMKKMMEKMEEMMRGQQP